MADEVRPPMGPAGALQRPRFEPEDYLTAADLRVEQAWRRQRHRRHNRHLHGYGVVCGLWVAPAFDTARPWAVFICPGYAIGPFGDEILVPCRVLVDLRDWLWSRPTSTGDGTVAYVAIRFREAAKDPAVTPSRECGCVEPGSVRDTRIADGFRIDVLWARPPEGTRPPFDLCTDLPFCAPCPETPHIVLAGVTLPLDEADPVGHAQIDNQREPSAMLLPLSLFVTGCPKKDADAHDATEHDDLRSVGVGAHLI